MLRSKTTLSVEAAMSEVTSMMAHRRRLILKRLICPFAVIMMLAIEGMLSKISEIRRVLSMK